MQNPYAPPAGSAGVAAESGRRRSAWRTALLAYAVHHGATMAGFLAGFVWVPIFWKEVVARDQHWGLALQATMVPMLDLYVLIEPDLVGESVPPTFLVLRWSRSMLLLTIPIIGLCYVVWRHRAALWYLGVVSFLIGMSLVITMAFDATR